MKIIIIVQTILAYCIGIGSLMVVNTIMNSILRRRFQIEEKNLAYGIFQVGIILSTAIILSSVIDPGINAIRLMNQNGFNMSSIVASSGFVVLFVIIGIFATFITIAGSVFTLFQITHVNEWEEIKNNNTTIAIISAAVVLGLSLIMDDYVGHLCEVIVPYPDVLNIR